MSLKRFLTDEDFMDGFNEPAAEQAKQWKIWDNYKAHNAQWGGMDHDPHDHTDGLYEIPYVKAGLQEYQRLVPESARHVLEIGCAQGFILNHVGGKSTKRTGVDFNEDRVRKGRIQYPDTEFIVGDIRDMMLPYQGYDCVLLPGILEHMRLQDARRLLELAWDVCEPGGLVIFDLPMWDGQSSSFNPGIHMNPCHAWVGTQYRWDWLFRGADVKRINLPEYPFYALGSIFKRPCAPETNGILVGCWGKIGDILHAMPMAQKMARVQDEPVFVVYHKDFAAVGSVLDMLEDIQSSSSAEDSEIPDWTARDLGYPHPYVWTRIINASHNGGRSDPVQEWTIFDWWDNNKHAIDFAAANAELGLIGNDRLLRFKPETLRKRRAKRVVFLSNTGDPGMRGVSAEWLEPLVKKVQDMGYKAVECSNGPICSGEDKRGMSLGQVVQLISGSKLVISMDTLASALIAQSVKTPIIRIYNGTKDSMTGAVLSSKYAKAVNGADVAIKHIEDILNGTN